GTPLPKDWSPTATQRAYAACLGLDVDAAVKGFLAYWSTRLEAEKPCWDSEWTSACDRYKAWGWHRPGSGLKGGAALSAACEKMREEVGMSKEEITVRFRIQTPAPVDPAVERAARIRQHIAQMPLDRSLYPEH